MDIIYRTFADTEVVMLATNIECPYCGEEWQEYDMDECGKTYNLECISCTREFQMHFDT